MHRTQSIALLVISSAVLAVLGHKAAFAEDPPPVPSYQEARDRFEAERSQETKGPRIRPADLAVMQQATTDLAARLPSPGLKIGEKAPDFTLPNAFGRPVRLFDKLKDGPVVLSFYRGAWCPYCNLQLHALHTSLPHFARHGAQLVAVTPQKPDKSLEQVEKDGYPFDILSDLDGSVMRAYRLHFEVPEELSDVYKRNFGLDLAEYNGQDRYVLPVPGTYVIDTGGIVRAAYADTDYKQRMEPKDIIAALQALQD